MADPVVPPIEESKISPPSTQTPDNKKPQDSGSDMTELAKKVGSYETENKTLKEYQQQVDPVLQTIWNDPQLKKQVELAHRKRLEGTVEVEEDKGKVTKENGQQPNAAVTDTKNAMIRQIVDNFSVKHGIDKLEGDTKKDMNTKVGAMLQELLDPMGNKNLAEIMQTVSLTKLPEYLDHAYYLANKETIVKAAKEEGKKEAVAVEQGIVGSFAATSIETENITLSEKERKTAKGLGISEEKYLARKKEIAKRGNDLY